MVPSQLTSFGFFGYLIMKKTLFLVLVVFSSNILAGDDDKTPSVLDKYSERELRCYTHIYEPSEKIHQKIKKRVEVSPPRDDDDDLENPVGGQAPPNFSEELSIIEELARNLGDDEIEHVNKVLEGFLNYLDAEDEFRKSYIAQINNVKDTVQIGGLSAFLAALLALPSAIAQIAQIDCVKYTCLLDNYSMVTTTEIDGQPSHYCGLEDEDFDCLRYQYEVYGNNVLTDAKYLPNCSENLDPAHINMTIPLGQITHYRDMTCTVLLATLPFLPSFALLIPVAALGAKTAYSTAELKIRVRRLNNHKNGPRDIDSHVFAEAKKKISPISPQIGSIVNFSGDFLGISSDASDGENYISALFQEDPIHQEVVEMAEESSFIATCKRGIRKAFWCCR